MGQSGLLNAGTVVVDKTGTVRILNPEGLPIEELNVPFMAYSTIEGIENISNWTVEVAGVEATDYLRVKARNGVISARWTPPGTVIIVR